MFVAHDRLALARAEVSLRKGGFQRQGAPPKEHKHHRSALGRFKRGVTVCRVGARVEFTLESFVCFLEIQDHVDTGQVQAVLQELTDHP